MIASPWLNRGIAIAGVIACWLAVWPMNETGGDPMPLTLTSRAFAHKTAMPTPCTCDGADMSPPLAWTDPPAGTKSFALIVDDPDAPLGMWVHWVLYNLPAASRSLAEHLPASDPMADGSRQGLNDFRRLGYGGPCPPPGSAHRYVFKLYALDAALTLPPRVTKVQLERAMDGRILAKAELIGLYQRKASFGYTFPRSR